MSPNHTTMPFVRVGHVGLAVLVLLLPVAPRPRDSGPALARDAHVSFRMGGVFAAAGAASGVSPENPPKAPKGGNGDNKHKRKRKNTSGKRKSGAVCDSTMGHRFNPVPPVHKAMHNKLSFCSKYRRNTCCNKTHTDVILRKDVSLRLQDSMQSVDASVRSCTVHHAIHTLGQAK